MSFRPTLDKKSMEQNRKVTGVERYYDSGIHSSPCSLTGSYFYPRTFPSKFSEKSAEENRKVPEGKKVGMPSFVPGLYGLSRAPLVPPPPFLPPPPYPFSTMPFPDLPLLGIPSPSPVNAAFLQTFPLGMPTFSRVSTPPSIIATSPFGKDATEILDPTKVKVILLIRVEIS